VTPGATAAPPLVQRLLDALPQTQCTRCGYPDCAAYAQAMATGEAGINQCPPGGAEGIARLAVITGQAAIPLDPAFGVEGPRSVAFIDEDWCIGCTLCLDACPTDAIIGSNKRMHTVLEQHCTGCELCLPVCPVDCILLENVSGSNTGWSAWPQPLADEARTRYSARQGRLVREHAEHAQRLQEKAEIKLADLPAHSQHTAPAVLDQKRAVIEAALARARARAKPGGAG
jgi:Na+-translocating ferredoxin:NAD+ oxidoreductase subunit B